MSDEKKPPVEPPAKGGGGAAGKILGLLLPAVIAGGASFGGAKFASGHPVQAAPSAAEHPEGKAPGPTLALDPFLLTVPDANKKAHAMKVTIAVEFDPASAKGEEGPKGLVPRIRDSALTYLRSLTFEEVLDASASDKMRSDLLERTKAAGVSGAERVLITDFVVQ